MDFAKNSPFTVITRLRPFLDTKHLFTRMLVAVTTMQRLNLSNPQRRRILRQIHLLNMDHGQFHFNFGQRGV